MIEIMKMFITAHYDVHQVNSDLGRLRKAVRDAGMDDFCFAEDITREFTTPKDLWECALSEIINCDGLLIDVSDAPSGGRVVEVGIAYALNKPIFVIVKNGEDYKEMYDGLATQIIRYDDYNDIAKTLSHYVASL